MLLELLDRILDRAPVRMGEQNGVVRYRIGHGATDAEQILSVLSSLIAEYGVDPSIRVFTTSLFTGCGNDDRSCQLNRITSWMEDNVRYVRDPLHVEYVRSPTAMLREYKEYGMANGDCDDQVLLSGAMLHSVGFQVRPVGRMLFTKDYFDHVAMQIVGDDNRIVNYDPCDPRDHFKTPEGDVLHGAFAGMNG